MRTTLVNFALLFGFIGFVGYIFIVIASFFGCCAGLTSMFYHKLVMFILIGAVVTFGICMYNNCCCAPKRNSEE